MKFIKTASALLCAVILAVSLTACGNGKSAYELAVESGYTGTQDEWLAGLNGTDGADGADAGDYLSDWYDRAVAEGYTGSFLDFVNDYSSALGISGSEYAVSKAMRSSVIIYSRFTTKTYSPFVGYVTKTAYSAGAGVIIADDKSVGNAYIVTNYHVIYDSSAVSEGGIAEYIGVGLYGMNIQVSSSDAAVLENSSLKAEFVGGSMDNDIAVLKISGSDEYKVSDCVPAEIADSDDVKLGEQAIAIGNPEGSGFSATTGTLSVDSEYITMEGLDGGSVTFRVMRVDTSINGGNSGGGLYDGRGRLIGIVNAKTNSVSIENISYAIPSNVAVGVAENIIRNGTFDRRSLDVTLSVSDSGAEYDEDTGLVGIVQTVVVASVASGGVSDGALMPDDVVQSITVKGKTTVVNRLFQVSDAMLYADAGTQVTLSVLRSGQPVTVTVTV